MQSTSTVTASLAEVKAELARVREEPPVVVDVAAKAAAEEAAVARVRTCVRELADANAATVVRDAFNSVDMMFSNIVRAPTAPRYRRILTDNATVSKAIVPLVGYDKLFSVVGFERSDKVWELKAGAGKDEVRRARRGCTVTWAHARRRAGASHSPCGSRA